MEEIDLSSLSEQEIMDMYSNVIESGQDVLIAKSCPADVPFQCGGSGTRLYCCQQPCNTPSSQRNCGIVDSGLG